ncbi:MAG: SO_0444 family Cu/Zn efflux transporter [bacterium]
MSQFLFNWADAVWAMLLDSSVLLLLGLVLAGLLRLALSEARVARMLTGGKIAAVFKAAGFGIPLPLCSCSVLPVAYQLRQSGVSRGATVSFLISTPESGIDSILLTWTMINPLMTIARPITAFLTAITAGLLEVNGDRREAVPDPIKAVCDSGCGCAAVPSRTNATVGWFSRLYSGLRYAFTDLVSDLSLYLLLGYLMAGLITVFWGPSAGGLPPALSSGWAAYLGAVLIGVPLYICATSSTPLAAALMAAGFSPGAALVFLMVGPATNLASIAVVGRILKGWSVVRYLVVIVTVSILCGLALDAIVTWLPSWWSAGVHSEMAEHDTGLVHFGAACILAGLITWYSLDRLRRWLR